MQENKILEAIFNIGDNQEKINHREEFISALSSSDEDIFRETEYKLSETNSHPMLQLNISNNMDPKEWLNIQNKFKLLANEYKGKVVVDLISNKKDTNFVERVVSDKNDSISR